MSAGANVSIAALTFTYNETVNLPIWLRYYGKQCGDGNLFVADRGSTDGSVADIGRANLIKLPRKDFDEYEKTSFINHMFVALLNMYDVVVYTDCDEILVPDPAQYPSLRAYIKRLKGDTARALGVDVLHIITQEQSLDVSRPILSQRGFGRFGSPSCKPLISKVPLRWLPGFHSCDRDVPIDPDLILFHLKLMDYAISTRRQLTNLETIWSRRSIEQDLGAHHRLDMKSFVAQSFLVPLEARYADFELAAELALFQAKTTAANGFWHVPMDIYKYVKFPERFQDLI